MDDEMRRIMQEKQFPNKPSTARVYDYLLGGDNYFPIDEQAAEHIMEKIPAAPYYALMNRDYLRRVVSWLVRYAGITQFLDLGSGIPTMENVHEVARRVNPQARIVYVDNDPIAVAESRNMLGATETVTAILSDLRDTDTVLNHPDTQRVLDFSQPIAVLFVAILHFVPNDDEVLRCVQTYRDATVAESYLGMSHGVIPDELPDTQVAEETAQVYQAYQETKFGERRVSWLPHLFDGYDLVEPGIVPLMQWRPDDQTPEHQMYVDRLYGGVGRKRDATAT